MNATQPVVPRRRRYRSVFSRQRSELEIQFEWFSVRIEPHGPNHTEINALHPRSIDPTRDARTSHPAAMAYLDPVPRLKELVAAEIVKRIDGWSQEMAASFLHTDQPRISQLRNGRLDAFSLQRLFRYAAHAGGEVRVAIAWTPTIYSPPPGFRERHAPPSAQVDFLK